MKKNIYKVLLIIWMIIIFIFSNDPSGKTEEKTNSFIETIIEIVEVVTGNEKNSEEIEKIVDELFYLIRKLAHFTEYFILGILMLLALKYEIKKEETLYYLSIIFCVLYAGSDEFHQLFVEGRNGNIKDVIIDSCGSILSITISCYYLWIKKMNQIVK